MSNSWQWEASTMRRICCGRGSESNPDWWNRKFRHEWRELDYWWWCPVAASDKLHQSISATVPHCALVNNIIMICKIQIWKLYYLLCISDAPPEWNRIWHSWLSPHDYLDLGTHLRGRPAHKTRAIGVPPGSSSHDQRSPHWICKDSPMMVIHSEDFSCRIKINDIKLGLYYGYLPYEKRQANRPICRANRHRLWPVSKSLWRLDSNSADAWVSWSPLSICQPHIWRADDVSSFWTIQWLFQDLSSLRGKRCVAHDMYVPARLSPHQLNHLIHQKI